MPKREWTYRTMTALGLGWLLQRLARWHGVLTLTYHRIGSPGDSPFDHDLWSATVEDFENQMRLLARHVDVIHPADLARVRGRGQGRYCLITFDDGYRDNYETAFPILRSLGLPATFFISTGFIDQPRAAWWDDVAWMVTRSLRAALNLRPWVAQPLPLRPGNRIGAIRRILDVYKSLPEEQTRGFLDAVAAATGNGRCPDAEARENWMTWSMLRAMQSAGMAMGGHTVNHPILARCSATRQREEIFGCGERLRDELDAPMRWFAYPRGKRDAFSDATRACLQQAGVEWAFTCYGGLQRFGRWDATDVKRTGIEPPLGWRGFQSLLACPRVFA